MPNEPEKHTNVLEVFLALGAQLRREPNLDIEAVLRAIKVSWPDYDLKYLSSPYPGQIVPVTQVEEEQPNPIIGNPETCLSCRFAFDMCTTKLICRYGPPQYNSKMEDWVHPYVCPEDWCSRYNKTGE